MFKIISDSTCDLPNELIKKYDISIAPLKITIDNKTYLDRVDISPDEFFSMIEGLKTPAKTAAPSPMVFLKLMEEALIKGNKEILVITMSSGTSACYQSATVAANIFLEEHDNEDIRIKVVDSISMSHGSGYLILKIAKLRANGMTYDDALEFCETFKKQIKHFLSVDDLDHLIRSGRLTNVSAVIGKILKIKPIMSMRNTKGAIVAKKRGRVGVLRHYIESFKQRVDMDLTSFIIIGYTSDKAYAENLKNKFINEVNFDGKIYIMQMGVSVGVHVGLGGLSLYFMEKEKLKDSLLQNEIKQINEAKDRIKKKLIELRENFDSE